MTDQERIALNTRLARAMGWDFIPHPSEIVNALEPDRGEWLTPAGKLYGDEPPDHTRDPAASRELVEWIKTQPIIFQDYFGTSLMRAIELEKELDYGEICGYHIPAILTAPLETIALAADAADAAIGGKDE